MADIQRPRIRLRPSEQRAILLFGDLVASAGAMFAALYIWYQFSLAREIARLSIAGFRNSAPSALPQTSSNFRFHFGFIFFLSSG
ncbi:MAG: hypothetical protein HYZ23_09895, partial [Chloroflexi bacterium]|nr:hypothetical protein [Chloroflexota bacterium]